MGLGGDTHERGAVTHGGCCTVERTDASPATPTGRTSLKGTHLSPRRGALRGGCVRGRYRIAETAGELERAALGTWLTGSVAMRLIRERTFTYHRDMLFAVVKLRKKGLRLTRTEIEAQPRAVGDLHFCAPPKSMDPARPRDPLKRPTKVAELRGEPIGAIHHTIIASLMDRLSSTSRTTVW